MSSYSEPCTTNRCHRDAPLLVRVGEDSEEKWKCEGCYNALLEGSKTEYSDIKVVNHGK